MPTGNQSTVVAVFSNRTDADNAARDLKANGFKDNDIYVGSYSNNAGGTSNREWEGTQHHEGGIKGWFESLFGHHDEENADTAYYQNAADRGGVMLSVNVAEQDLDRVSDILDKYNPVDMTEEAPGTQNRNVNTAAGAATSSAAATAPRVATPTTTGAGATTAANAGKTAASVTGDRTPTTGRASTSSTDLPKAIPVVQEDLRVGKRSILRGGVRVYSRVIQQPVEENVRLREEHVRVDRQPVNRELKAGDLTPGRDEVIEVQEFAEEPVVEKQARVVEEVRINKEASERTETVRDNVRRTEVKVENLGQGTGRTGSYDEDFRRDFQTRYASSGARYEDYGPAYEYGYSAANDPRYQGRNWDDVESDLRSDYGRRYPNSAWDRMKDSIRYGWDKVTGRARGAAGSR